MGVKFQIPIILYLLHYTNGLPRVDPLVDTKIGLIRGLAAPDGDYSMFLGIPYATVNASNPFGPSIPHSGFENTFEAFDDSAICPQREEFTNSLTGTLDCLHLNVYVPNIASSKNPLPVLVWIYGGGFSIGFSGRYVYGPKYLVRHDVILVTINYRLGVYGFMCLDTPDVPGNQGLKDQLTALRWIKKNIEAFGGDSDKITIFGESAGGSSVDFQYLYTQEDLFNKIIMQSGNGLTPFAFTESDVDAPLRLANHLGFSTDNVESALSFLTTVDTDLIVAATEQINYMPRPCLERKFENVENLILDYPINIDLEKSKLKVPILIGFNNDERLANYINKSPEYFSTLNVFYDILKANFNFEDDYLQMMVDSVRQFYIGDDDITENVKRDLDNFESDFTFIHPTHRGIQKYLEHGVSNIYFYMFSYSGGRNFVKYRNNITEGGAAHADEISYLFDVSFIKEIPTTEDQIIIDRITTLWTNFVKYSNPTPEETDLLPLQWPTVTKDSLSCLNIDLDLSVIKRPFHDRVAFWDLFYKLNTKYQKYYSEN